MKHIFVSLDDKGRVDGWGSSATSSNFLEIDIEESHDFFLDPFSYKAVDDNIVKMTEEEIKGLQPEPEVLPPSKEEITDARLEQLEEVILQLMMMV